IYDAMAEISRRMREDEGARQQHRDLAALSDSGYLRNRFESEGLPRPQGEVSRTQLWARIDTYMKGSPTTKGALYCRHVDHKGQHIELADLLYKGPTLYGGVGKTRYVYDPERPDASMFADIYGEPRLFQFFTPTAADLVLPQGIVLNSGRAAVIREPARVAFATATFNSGKHTPPEGMPAMHPVLVSESLAASLGLRSGDWVELWSPATKQSQAWPVQLSAFIKGETIYRSFHKCRRELLDGVYLNDLVDHRPRCGYSSQTRLKAAVVVLRRVSAPAEAQRWLEEG
ncbi:MAG: hypothetical protein KUG77_18815, partial [Nannocystaceae bacterium]|nr:hypothetical protein [Nannocystaceae bacterium]